MAKRKSEDAPVASEPSGEKKKPAQSFRYAVAGGTLAAALWPKQVTGQNGDRTLYSVSLQRSYYDENEKAFRYTDLIRENDIPAAIVVLQRAAQWLSQKRDPEEPF